MDVLESLGALQAVATEPWRVPRKVRATALSTFCSVFMGLLVRTFGNWAGATLLSLCDRFGSQLDWRLEPLDRGLELYHLLVLPGFRICPSSFLQTAIFDLAHLWT